MPHKAKLRVDEATLTKGQVRKLNTLRKSVGAEIGEKAFAAWLTTQAEDAGTPADKNAELIAGTLKGLVNANRLRIPRGGYLVVRGRGRVIVTRAKPA